MQQKKVPNFNFVFHIFDFEHFKHDSIFFCLGSSFICILTNKTAMEMSISDGNRCHKLFGDSCTIQAIGRCQARISIVKQKHD